MGGGEIARYIGNHGEDRLHSVVFAGAVPPYLLKTDDNPDGGLGEDDVAGMEQGAREDREGFLDGFTTNFFSADGELKVTEEQRQDALALAAKARDEAVVGCIGAFGRTDFRNDLVADHGADAGHPRRLATRSCPSRSPAGAPPRRSRAAPSWSSRAARTAST